MEGERLFGVVGRWHVRLRIEIKSIKKSRNVTDGKNTKWGDTGRPHGVGVKWIDVRW